MTGPGETRNGSDQESSSDPEVPGGTDRPASDGGKDPGPRRSTSFAASSLQTLVVRLTVLGANLATGIITARWLGPERLGVYYLVALLPVMAFHFGNLGFGTALSYFGAREQASGRQLHRIAWSLGLVLALASGLALAAFRDQGISPWRDVEAQLFFLFLLSVPLEFWILYSQRVLNGKLLITQVNISSAIRGYSVVGLLFLFVVVLDLGLRGALIAVVLSMLLTCVYLGRQTGRLSRLTPPDAPELPTKDLLWSMWRYGRWAFLILLVSYLCVQLPILVMAQFSSKEEIAFYAVARALARKTELLTLPFSAILLPFTAAAATAGDAIRRTNTLCRVFAFALPPLAVVLAVAVWLIIPLMYGAEYLPAVAVFWAALPGIVFWPLGNFLGLHVVATGRPKIVFLADLLLLAAAAAASGLLIPRFGAVGAGLSFSCINASMFVFRLVVYRRVTGARLGEILVPRAADWLLCRGALTRSVARLLKRTGTR